MQPKGPSLIAVGRISTSSAFKPHTHSKLIVVKASLLVVLKFKASVEV